jgi:hypothetical protein
MKQLGDFLDPNLDRIRGGRRICAAGHIRCMPHLVNDLAQDRVQDASTSCTTFMLVIC